MKSRLLALYKIKRGDYMDVKNRTFSSFGWVFFYLATYMAFQLSYSFLAFAIKGSGLENSAEVSRTIIFAGVSSLLVYIAVVRFRKKNFLEECRFKTISTKHLIASGALGVSGLGVSSILLAALSLFLDSAYLDHMENMELILRGNSLLVFVSVGVVAPLIEEILFRGLVFRELEKIFDSKWAVFVQAILFGVYHLNMAQGVYTTFLGVVLGFALLWTGSIWAPIVIHIVNNSLSFLFSFIGQDSEILLFFLGSGLILVIAFFPLLMRYLYKTRVERNH